MDDDEAPDDPAHDPGRSGDEHDGVPVRTLAPPSELEYERWWKEYKAGARSPAKLARIVRARIHRVRHAVRFGWPDKNFPALQDRLKHTAPAVAEAVRKVVTESEVKAAEAVARVMAGTWEDAARVQLSTAASTTEALARLGERLAQAAAAASFVSFRRVPDKDPVTGQVRRDARGNVITVLKEHVSAFTVAAAAARLAAAAKDHATLSKALLASIAPGQPQGVLLGPPAVILYMPDNNTGPGSATGGDDGNGP